jgi:hypothetical protein
VSRHFVLTEPNQDAPTSVKSRLVSVDVSTGLIGGDTAR